MRREIAGGAQHQIVLAKPGERGGFRPAHFKRKRVGRCRYDLVADIGERDEAIKQMVAVRPAADDV
jgi:hypothetical protein